MSGPSHELRRARAADAPAIASVINEYAERGLMVHRSLPELYDRLRDFHVADRGGTIDGVVGLGVMWANLAELYGLAVRPSACGGGVGRHLVEAAVADAETLGVRRVFALTSKRALFERLGFHVIDRNAIPLKVWSERLRAEKHKVADDWALLRVLDHVSDAAPPAPDEPDYESSLPTGSDRLGLGR